MSPVKRHEHAVIRIQRQLNAQLPGTHPGHLAHPGAVDPREGTGIVHSQSGYASREKFAFGDTTKAGPWTIDTSGLLTYG